MADHFKPENQYGDWTREKQLGSGACGTVYMWKNSKKNEEIAIKKCKLTDNQDAMRRWKTEVDMIKGMCHPNIVSYIEIPSILEKEYPRYCSLGMEYCSVGDLRKFIARTEHSCGLPEYHVRDVMVDIGYAIHYLHEKHNMHRDLKPENIVLKPRPDCPNRFLYKITDLGYAKDLDITRGHTLVGTLQYLAPELVLESRRQLCYYTEVDFWSFGMVVFECATGFRPFFHLSNSEPPLAVNYVKDKHDEIICAWHEGNDMKFHDGIPQPHLLNPYFANDVVLWLRLMLCVDKKRRGGKDGKEWYTMLMEKVIAKKYVQVVNTATMSVLVFPLEESALPRTVQMKIQSETSVSDADQLLLLGKGEVPNMTGKMLQQLERIDPNTPDNPVIYFFDKQSRQWPHSRSQTPEIIRQFQRNPNATTDHKRFMQIVLHVILSKVKIGHHYYNAVTALMERVSKVSDNLKIHLQEFVAEYNTIAGKVSLFELSLRKDMEEADNQTNASEICSGDDYKKECEALLRDVESWKKEIQEARELIQEAHKELSKKRSSDLSNFKEKLDEIGPRAIKFCHDFRVEYRKIEHNMERTQNYNAEAKEKTLKIFCKTQLQRYQEARTLVDETLSPQSESRREMRVYIDHLMKLERIHFSMKDKKQRCSCISSDLEEKQKRRQHSLWNMLRYMKEVYNIAHSYQHDPNAVADLTNSEEGLCNFMGRFMNDPDLLNIIHFTPPVPLQQETVQLQQAGSMHHRPQGAEANVNGRVPASMSSSQIGYGSYQLSGYGESSVQISSQNNPSIPNGESR